MCYQPARFVWVSGQLALDPEQRYHYPQYSYTSTEDNERGTWRAEFDDE